MNSYKPKRLIILVLTVFLSTCAPAAPTISPVILTNEVVNTLAPTNPSSVMPVTFPTETATETAATPSPTSTASIATPSPENATMVESPTETNIPGLHFCNTSIQNICINIIYLNQAKSAMAVVLTIKQESSAKRFDMLFDGIKSRCIPLGVNTDQYDCEGLPSRLNKNIFIQVFNSGSTVLLAEGNVFLGSNHVTIEPIPTTKPMKKPPTPYQP